MKLDKNKEYALALSGGGARGSYQIGVWKALRENGIKINAVTGTSIGAINGALIAQGDFDEAMEIWENISPDVIYNLNASGIDKVRDISKLGTFLEKYIDEERVRASDVEYGLVTVNVTTLEPVVKFIEDIPKGKLLEYILASANYPVFYRQEIDGDKYVDGGLFDNLPIAPLADKGYEDIIAVDICAVLSTIFREEVPKTANVFTVRSRHSLHKQFLFDPVKVKENLLKGYCDLKLYNGEYVSTHYYIKGYSDNKHLNSLDKEDIKMLIKKDSIKESIKELFSNEKVLRNYLKALNEYASEGSGKISNLRLTDKEFFTASLEITAELFEVEAIREYEYDEFIRELYRKIIEVMANSRSIEKIFSTKDINEFISESLNVNLFDKKILFANLFISKNKISLLEEIMYKNFPKVSVAFITSFIVKNKMEQYM